MSTEAWERAVEAGAAEYWRDHHERYGGPWSSLPTNAVSKIQTRATTAAILRAAFPILAEEVLNAANAYTKEQYGYGFLGHPVDRARIVARIEQMKEITE